MKIKMLKTRQGSPDGMVVNTYTIGESVDVPDELAQIFIRHRWARKITVAKAKNQGKAPENKTTLRGDK
ncbi:MAG: hypothetical protein HOJ79_14630 [Nitrospina sp.]|jgi:hypothetical protein|nr:hypothetical protein [Nitrospina sp.]